MSPQSGMDKSYKGILESKIRNCSLKRKEEEKVGQLLLCFISKWFFKLNDI